MFWPAEFWGVPSWRDVLADTRLCGTVLLRSCQRVPLHLCTVCVCVCVLLLNPTSLLCFCNLLCNVYHGTAHL